MRTFLSVVVDVASPSSERTEYELFESRDLLAPFWFALVDARAYSTWRIEIEDAIHQLHTDAASVLNDGEIDALSERFVIEIPIRDARRTLDTAYAHLTDANTLLADLFSRWRDTLMRLLEGVRRPRGASMLHLDLSQTLEATRSASAVLEGVGELRGQWSQRPSATDASRILEEFGSSPELLGGTVVRHSLP